MTTTYAEIVQPARNLHHEIRHALCGQAQDIFDNPTPFHPGQHIFDDHTGAGDERIEEFVLHAQLLASGLFLGLLRQHPRGFIALKTRVLPQRRVGGIDNLCRVGRFLVMRFAGHGGAQIDHFGRVGIDQDHVFVRVRFFCRCTAPFAARHWWDVGAGVPCRR